MAVIAAGRELAALAAEAVVLVAKNAGVGRAELGVVVIGLGLGPLLSLHDAGIEGVTSPGTGAWLAESLKLQQIDRD